MYRNTSSSGANLEPLGQRSGHKPIECTMDVSSLLKPSYMGGNSSYGDVLIQSNYNAVSDPGNKIHFPKDRPALQAPSSHASQALAVAADIASKLGKRKTFDSIDTRPGMDKLAQLSQPAVGRGEKRKRKSRWTSSEVEKTFIPGMPTSIPAGLNKEQEEAYLLQIKIEDASRRLRCGDLGIPPNPDDRSPSPEPVYSTDGKRMNTREYRKRKQLEDTRHQSIIRMGELNPEYLAPADYKPPLIKICDRVVIPHLIYPDINFVGLLIGPRGNTLKALERETGAKIIIRGKGSVKEGKVGRKDGMPLPGEDEPLHAYITSTCPEAVKRGIEKVKQVIAEGVNVPESQNDLRKQQLRELALLNGTLRDADPNRCTNCGSIDHKAWQCQDKPSITNTIMCTTCAGFGHIARDCMVRKSGVAPPAPVAVNPKMDDEYMSLMAELGEGPPPPPRNNAVPAWQQNRPMVRPPGMPMQRPMALMGPPGTEQYPVSHGTEQYPGPPGIEHYPGPPGTEQFSGPSGMEHYPGPPGTEQYPGPPPTGGGWAPPPPAPGMQRGPPPLHAWRPEGTTDYGMPPPQFPGVRPPPSSQWNAPPINSGPVPPAKSLLSTPGGDSKLKSPFGPHDPLNYKHDDSNIQGSWGHSKPPPSWSSGGGGYRPNVGVLTKLIAAPPPPPPS